MLEQERHQLILDQLKNNQTIKLQHLVDITNSSESTIRRDLTQLEMANQLKRVHGGASRLQGTLYEANMAEKSAKNIHHKQKIAQFAAKLVQENECIYLDAGSTVYELILHLPNNIVVVTNGLTHVDALIEHQIKTYVVGGYAKPTTKALIGKGAVNGLKQYRFDKCFLGVNGIHQQAGFTTPDPEEAIMKQTAIDLSREAFVLADESKFHEITFAKVADLAMATIITNQIDEDIQTQFSDKTMIKVVTS